MRRDRAKQMCERFHLLVSTMDPNHCWHLTRRDQMFSIVRLERIAPDVNWTHAKTVEEKVVAIKHVPPGR